MSNAMKGRSLLTLEEFSASEVAELIALARDLKREKAERQFAKHLLNRNFCLISLKPSARTRSAFVVAAADEGAHLEIFSAEDIRFGSKESVKDIARVLGRMFDGIAFRGFAHSTAVELADYAGVPIWNGLTDEHHPTQVLADLMTIEETFGRLQGVKVAYVGDGRNNMVTSLAIGALKTGLDLRIVAPEPLQPAAETVAAWATAPAHRQAKVTVTADVGVGVGDCDVVYGDVWVSMGEEDLVGDRIRLLGAYKVTAEVMDATGKPDAVYLHCLPALHALDTDFARAHPDVLEVSDTVFEGSQSRVFDQAENRMHTIKAVMVATV